MGADHWFAAVGETVDEANVQLEHGKAGRDRTATDLSLRPRLLYVLVGALSLLAYLALALGGSAPWGRYLDHGVGAPDGARTPLGSALFLVAWTIMVTAMMLPTAVPLFEAFGRIVSRRAQRRRLLAILAAGFVGVWAVLGYVLLWADTAVHAAVDRLEVVADRPQLIAAVVLAAAGIYQFSELKRRCLMRCRSPLSLIVPRWSGDGPVGDAFRIGVAYGTYCVGCCWMLMVLVFAIGAGNVGLMIALGLLMAIEKNVPRARRLTSALGTILVGLGVTIAISTLA